MADDNKTTATAQPDTTAPPATPERSPNNDPAGEPERDETDEQKPDKRLTSERRLRRDAEARATDLQKSVEQLTQRVRQFEDANKTEEQRRAEALDAAKAETAQARSDADAARLELLRYQVGSEKQLSAALIPRLVGSNRDELEADADRLREELAGNAKPRKPQPDPRLGRSADGQLSTAEQFAAAVKNIL